MSVLLFILFFILVLLCATLLFRKDYVIRLEDAKRLNETEHSYYFTYQNQSIHYTERGKGETVILLHGLGDSFQNYNAFEALLNQQYKVIRIDLPAFGLSEVPKITFENNEVVLYYRTFLTSFLKGKGIADFHLVGNSLGGLLSWDYTVYNEEFNIKSLTLLASAGFDMVRVKKNITLGVLEHLPKFILKKGAPLFFSKLAADTCIVDKNKITPAFVRAHSSMLNKQGTVNFFFDLIDDDFEPETNKLATIKVPTLIVWGKKDKIISYQHATLFEEAIPNSKKIVYEKCGHYPQIEFPEKLMEDWSMFVNKIQ